MGPKCIDSTRSAHSSARLRGPATIAHAPTWTQNRKALATEAWNPSRSTTGHRTVASLEIPWAYNWLDDHAPYRSTVPTWRAVGSTPQK